MQSDEFLKNDAFLSKELLELACESSGIGVWKVDPATRAVELTASLKQMMGLPAEGALDYAAFLAMPHDDDREQVRDGLAAALSPAGDGTCQMEFRLITPAGDTKWLAARGRAYFQGNGGARTATVFVGTMRDITDHKASAERQEARLHAVNHRVNNSLQLVSSLLRLQARRAPDSTTRAQLEDATARISTIAHIHQRLYRDQDIERLNFGAFLSELCADLQGSAPNCALTVRSPDFRMTTDRAIPMALVVNELIGNAVKYAYPDTGGPVAVDVELRQGGDIAIAIRDEGVGVPDDFTIGGAGNMGMMLISSLLGQLSGRIDVHRNAERGSTFTVIVPGDGKDL